MPVLGSSLDVLGGYVGNFHLCSKMGFSNSCLCHGFFHHHTLMAEILHHLGCIKPWQLKDTYQRVQDFLHQQYLLTLASSQIPPWTWLFTWRRVTMLVRFPTRFYKEMIKLHEPIFDFRKNGPHLIILITPQTSTKTTSQRTSAGTESDISITFSCHWAKLLMAWFKWCLDSWIIHRSGKSRWKTME